MDVLAFIVIYIYILLDSHWKTQDEQLYGVINRVFLFSRVPPGHLDFSRPPEVDFQMNIFTVLLT